MPLGGSRSQQPAAARPTQGRSDNSFSVLAAQGCTSPSCPQPNTGDAPAEPASESNHLGSRDQGHEEWGSAGSSNGAAWGQRRQLSRATASDGRNLGPMFDKAAGGSPDNDHNPLHPPPHHHGLPLPLYIMMGPPPPPPPRPKPPAASPAAEAAATAAASPPPPSTPPPAAAAGVEQRHVEPPAWPAPRPTAEPAPAQQQVGGTPPPSHPTGGDLRVSLHQLLRCINLACPRVTWQQQQEQTSGLQLLRNQQMLLRRYAARHILDSFLASQGMPRISAAALHAAAASDAGPCNLVNTRQLANYRLSLKALEGALSTSNLFKNPALSGRRLDPAALLQALSTAGGVFSISGGASNGSGGSVAAAAASTTVRLDPGQLWRFIPLVHELHPGDCLRFASTHRQQQQPATDGGGGAGGSPAAASASAGHHHCGNGGGSGPASHHQGQGQGASGSGGGLQGWNPSPRSLPMLLLHHAIDLLFPLPSGGGGGGSCGDGEGGCGEGGGGGGVASPLLLDVDGGNGSHSSCDGQVVGDADGSLDWEQLHDHEQEEQQQGQRQQQLARRHSAEAGRGGGGGGGEGSHLLELEHVPEGEGEQAALEQHHRHMLLCNLSARAILDAFVSSFTSGDGHVAGADGPHSAASATQPTVPPASPDPPRPDLPIPRVKLDHFWMHLGPAAAAVQRMLKRGPMARFADVAGPTKGLPALLQSCPNAAFTCRSADQGSTRTVRLNTTVLWRAAQAAAALGLGGPSAAAYFPHLVPAPIRDGHDSSSGHFQTAAAAAASAAAQLPPLPPLPYEEEPGGFTSSFDRGSFPDLAQPHEQQQQQHAAAPAAAAVPSTSPPKLLSYASALLRPTEAAECERRMKQLKPASSSASSSAGLTAAAAALDMGAPAAPAVGGGGRAAAAAASPPLPLPLLLRAVDAMYPLPSAAAVAAADAATATQAADEADDVLVDEESREAKLRRSLLCNMSAKVLLVECCQRQAAAAAVAAAAGAAGDPDTGPGSGHAAAAMAPGGMQLITKSQLQVEKHVSAVALVLLKELASGPYSRFRSLAGPNLTKGLTALLRGALLFKVGTLADGCTWCVSLQPDLLWSKAAAAAAAAATQAGQQQALPQQRVTALGTGGGMAPVLAPTPCTGDTCTAPPSRTGSDASGVALLGPGDHLSPIAVVARAARHEGSGMPQPPPPPPPRGASPRAAAEDAQLYPAMHHNPFAHGSVGVQSHHAVGAMAAAAGGGSPATFWVHGSPALQGLQGVSLPLQAVQQAAQQAVQQPGQPAGQVVPQALQALHGGQPAAQQAAQQAGQVVSQALQGLHHQAVQAAPVVQHAMHAEQAAAVQAVHASPPAVTPPAVAMFGVNGVVQGMYGSAPPGQVMGVWGRAADDYLRNPAAGWGSGSDESGGGGARGGAGNGNGSGGALAFPVSHSGGSLATPPALGGSLEGDGWGLGPWGNSRVWGNGSTAPSLAPGVGHSALMRGGPGAAAATPLPALLFSPVQVLAVKEQLFQAVDWVWPLKADTCNGLGMYLCSFIAKRAIHQGVSHHMQRLQAAAGHPSAQVGHPLELRAFVTRLQEAGMEGLMAWQACATYGNSHALYGTGTRSDDGFLASRLLQQGPAAGAAIGSLLHQWQQQQLGIGFGPGGGDALLVAVEGEEDGGAGAEQVRLNVLNLSVMAMSRRQAGDGAC